MTEAELKLWNELRAHRLMGLSFKRQVPIAGYIVDFACSSKRLIVEVDGSQHAEGQQLKIDDIDDVCQHIVITAGLATPVGPLNLQEEQHP